MTLRSLCCSSRVDEFVTSKSACDERVDEDGRWSSALAVSGWVAERVCLREAVRCCGWVMAK